MLIKLGFTLSILFSTLTPIKSGLVSFSLQQKVQGSQTHDAIIELPSVTSEVLGDPSLTALKGNLRVEAMVNQLQDATGNDQQPFMNVINEMGATEKATQFWISNKIRIKDADQPLLDALTKVPGTFIIREPFKASVNPLSQQIVNITTLAQSQWGVQKIGACDAWSKTRGQNVIVATIDTGANLNHEALRYNFAGAWHDPVYGAPQPTDPNGHGSHAMGSICGNANGIGVAPRARWIACRGLDAQGRGDESYFSECAQWMLQANPRPHVISNSWGGGEGLTWFNDAISAWRYAGIIPVFAIGNSGPECRTANSPGDQPNVISVGATAWDDSMAFFSSRGRAASGVTKPEVSAPGKDIISAGGSRASSSSYVKMSGTSMACPHVAGAVALLLSANPGMGFDEVLYALQNTAYRPSLTNADLQCGTSSGGYQYPNNAYGYGRINVLRALQ